MNDLNMADIMTTGFDKEKLRFPRCHLKIRSNCSEQAPGYSMIKECAIVGSRNSY